MRFIHRFQIPDITSRFKAGEVLGYPTEGVYGMGCRADLTDSVQRVIDAKKRAPNKGLILLGCRTEDFQEFVADQNELLEARNNDPSWCTWVVKAAAGVDPLLTGGRDSLAVRVTEHPLMAEIIDRLGVPIVSTSANLSGRAPHPRPWLTPWGQSLDGWYQAPLGGYGKSSPIRLAATGEYLRK